MHNDPSLNGRLACVTSYACFYDQRFSYYVYLPRNFASPEAPSAYDLLVLVHGTERGGETYRNKFKRFANTHNLAIMAPLFPAGIAEPRELENYRHIRYRGIEFDTILFKMIEEMAERFPINSGRFHLHGFSSGGQFVNRLLYLHPHRFLSLSIGAPGEATFPCSDQNWPLGLGGAADIFGQMPSLDALRGLPVQIVAGAADTTPRPALDDAPNRLERAKLLYRSFKEIGLNVRLDVVPDAGHDGFKVLPAVMEFFETALSAGPGG
ncbi:hypothetical protein LJB99_01290 [Deltaproteobacteria bacterium OttesenSCG-928-K17]|nr:hypothetical protein [Deltaproteobacteria bacterium OttesenSCG-928-K17]